MICFNTAERKLHPAYILNIRFATITNSHRYRIPLKQRGIPTISLFVIPAGSPVKQYTEREATIDKYNKQKKQLSGFEAECN